MGTEKQRMCSDCAADQCAEGCRCPCHRAVPSAEPAPASQQKTWAERMKESVAGQPATAPDEEKTQMDNQQEMPIACISGELVSKPCSEMTNVELADFIEQGAWRVGANGSDESAYREAAKRLRQQVELLS